MSLNSVNLAGIEVGVQNGSVPATNCPAQMVRHTLPLLQVWCQCLS